jgi:predicted  nucleic acid-binding Zn-ribbon protein
LTVDLELEVKGLQQKIEQNERRLYSGKIGSPKEAGALQDEVASTKRWLSKREEDLLEAMITLEEEDIALQERKTHLETVQATWQADQSDLLQEQRALAERFQTLAKSRKTAAKLVPETDLAQYERLRVKLGGVALAEVDDGICLSCGVQLSSRAVQQAQTDNRLHYCDSCQRIIHVM